VLSLVKSPVTYTLLHASERIQIRLREKLGAFPDFIWFLVLPKCHNLDALSMFYGGGMVFSESRFSPWAPWGQVDVKAFCTAYKYMSIKYCLLQSISTCIT